MVVNLEPMEAPAKGYRLTSPQTESVFSVWEVVGKIYDAPLGVRCPVERLGRRVEVESLMEGVEWVKKEYETFFHAEVLFLLSIHLRSLNYELTSFFEEKYLAQTDFFNRFSLMGYRKKREIPGWVCPFLEERQCIKRR